MSTLICKVVFMGGGACILAALWLGGCASQRQTAGPVVGEASPAMQASAEQTQQVVRFMAGSAELSTEQAAALDALAVRLKQQELYLQIEGYADGTSLLADTRRLADARAQAVYQRLRRQGVEPGRMTLISRAEAEPRLLQAATDSPAPRRQVVIATVQ